MNHIKPLVILFSFILASCNVETPFPSSSETKKTDLEILKSDMVSSNCQVDLSFTRYLDHVSYETKMEFSGNAIQGSQGENVSYYVLEDNCIRMAVASNGAYYYTSDRMQCDSTMLSPSFVFPLFIMGTCSCKENMKDIFANLKDSDLEKGEDGRIHMSDIVLHPIFPDGLQIINYEDEDAVIKYKDIYLEIEDDHLTKLECNFRAVSIENAGEGKNRIVPDTDDQGSMILEFSHYGEISFELPSPILDH